MITTAIEEEENDHEEISLQPRMSWDSLTFVYENDARNTDNDDDDADNDDDDNNGNNNNNNNNNNHNNDVDSSVIINYENVMYYNITF